jgi:hypothetical protein
MLPSMLSFSHEVRTDKLNVVECLQLRPPHTDPAKNGHGF